MKFMVLVFHTYFEMVILGLRLGQQAALLLTFWNKKQQRIEWNKEKAISKLFVTIYDRVLLNLKKFVFVFRSEWLFVVTLFEMEIFYWDSFMKHIKMVSKSFLFRVLMLFARMKWV